MAESIALADMSGSLIAAALKIKDQEAPGDALPHIQNIRVTSDILVALARVGCLTADQALGLIGKHTPAAPFHKDGVWHCPTCNSRAKVWHSYCHQCGQKMNWGRFKK